MRKISNLFMVLGTVLILAALSLLIYNQRQDRAAGEAARDQLLELKDQITREQMSEIENRTEIKKSDLVLPDDPSEMTCVEVDGNFYIGVLSVPGLGIELPVMSDWSYPKLRIAPCRYFGSAYTDNLVIAAHNYVHHFGSLEKLSPGDLVIFTDVNQIHYSYEVEQVVTLESTDVDIVTEGDYPRTLFTCTYDGSMRVTVQCRKLNEVPSIR